MVVDVDPHLVLDVPHDRAAVVVDGSWLRLRPAGARTWERVPGGLTTLAQFCRSRVVPPGVS